MGYFGAGVVRRGASIVLSATLAAGMIPTIALAHVDSEAASGVDEVAEGSAALDPQSLPDGTYQVTVKARQTADVSTESMLSGALVNPATVTVKDGVYTLTLNLQGIAMTGVTGYANTIQYYDGGAQVSGSSVVAQGNLQDVSVDALLEDGVHPKTVSFTLPESAKSQSASYVVLKLKVDNAPMPTVTSALYVDWSSLPNVEPPATTDKKALEDAIAAAEALQQGNKTDVSWNELQAAIKEAKAKLADDSLDQAAVDAAAASLNAAVQKFNDSRDRVTGGYDLVDNQEYEVPVSLVKYDTPTELSMANGYLNQTGTVAWNSETSRFTVKFSFTEEGQGYLQGIDEATDLGGGVWSIDVDTIDQYIPHDVPHAGRNAEGVPAHRHDGSSGIQR